MTWILNKYLVNKKMKQYRGKPIFAQYSHLLPNHIAGKGCLAWAHGIFQHKK